MVNVRMNNAPASLDFERVFRHLDRNGGGKISPSELNHHLGLGLTQEEEELCLLSVRRAASDDGMMGMDDLVHLIEAGDEEDKLRDLKEAFRMYDGGNCGFITPESLRAMLIRLGESKSTQDCQAMISRFDLDGDGVLSFDEFRAMML